MVDLPTRAHRRARSPRKLAQRLRTPRLHGLPARQAACKHPRLRPHPSRLLAKRRLAAVQVLRSQHDRHAPRDLAIKRPENRHVRYGGYRWDREGFDRCEDYDGDVVCQCGNLSAVGLPASGTLNIHTWGFPVGANVHYGEVDGPNDLGTVGHAYSGGQVTF